MRPDATLPALSPDDARDLAAAGIVASPTRPGRWDDSNGTSTRDRGLTTTAALRRARNDLTPNGRAPAGATAEALIEPTQEESDSMDRDYTDAAPAQLSEGARLACDAELARVRYETFVAAKKAEAPVFGFEPGPLSEVLFAFQRDIVRWAIRRGRAAIFAKFGLGKSLMQLECGRQVCLHTGGRFLIVAPLGVRGEFVRDAAMLGVPLTFVRRSEEVDAPGLYLTNYESVRDGKLDPAPVEDTHPGLAGALRAEAQRWADAWAILHRHPRGDAALAAYHRVPFGAVVPAAPPTHPRHRFIAALAAERAPARRAEPEAPKPAAPVAEQRGLFG